MNVGIILSHINKSLQWQWLSEAYRREGVPHFFVLIDTREPLLAGDLRAGGTPVYFLQHRSALSHPANFARLVRLLVRHRPDIVHTSLPYGNLLGQLACVVLGIPGRVTTCENASWADDFGSGKQTLIDRLTFRAARRVIAISEVAARYLRERWRVPRSRLLTIPHALRPEDFAAVTEERVERLRRQLGLPGGEMVVGMVARFEHWKGHAYVVEALRSVAARRPHTRLVICGSGGPCEQAVQTQVRKAGLADRVTFAGFVDDPLAMYRLFDVQVHVPINAHVETGGITILEGMMSGRAQVLTRSGYAWTTARDRRNCLVVDYCDARAISDAVTELLGDGRMRGQLGGSARDDALRHFSFAQKARDHLAVYRELLAAPDRTGAP